PPPPARAPDRRRPASTCGRPAGSRRTSRSTGARSPRPRGGTRTRCASVLHLIDLEGQGLQATTVGGRDLLLVAPADVDGGEHAGVGDLGVTPVQLLSGYRRHPHRESGHTLLDLDDLVCCAR